jgi:hypothetical protein
LTALDDAPTKAPLNHEAARQDVKQAFRNAKSVFSSLKDLPVPPRIEQAFRSNRVAITVSRDRSRVQVYYPDYGVAGEGRCICEAASEAAEALVILLEAVRDAQDWAGFPVRDVTIATSIAVVRTNADFLVRQSRSRIARWVAGLGNESPESLDEIKSGLSFA